MISVYYKLPKLKLIPIPNHKKISTIEILSPKMFVKSIYEVKDSYIKKKLILKEKEEHVVDTGYEVGNIPLRFTWPHMDCLLVGHAKCMTNAVIFCCWITTQWILFSFFKVKWIFNSYKFLKFYFSSYKKIKLFN